MGCTLNCEPSWLSVFSPRIASIATRALNFGLYCFLVVVIDLSSSTTPPNLTLLPGLKSGDHYNTSTSLGRLTLNILLSFAQFERELIGERTRDKMSAARRKGKWVVGCPVLGYDVDPGGGRLVVNEEEADRVRAIFALFEEHRSVVLTLAEME